MRGRRATLWLSPEGVESYDFREAAGGRHGVQYASNRNRAVHELSLWLMHKNRATAPGRGEEPLAPGI